MHTISLKTAAETEFLDITHRVRQTVQADGIENGVCHVFVPHTTAGVTINEHADPSVMRDVAARLEKLVPQDGTYRHLEGNSPGHIKALLTGSSVTVFIENGNLVLGTWQGIFFCEYDGPRSRSVIVKNLHD